MAIGNTLWDATIMIWSLIVTIISVLKYADNAVELLSISIHLQMTHLGVILADKRGTELRKYVFKGQWFTYHDKIALQRNLIFQNPVGGSHK